MSILDKIDKMLLSEAKLRGFKDKKALGLEIEDMEMNVIDREVLKFTKIIFHIRRKPHKEMVLLRVCTPKFVIYISWRVCYFLCQLFTRDPQSFLAKLIV